jgi:3-hexulose-6-phosphate synthase
MKIQLALDRMNVAEAIALTRKVENSIDWIEVGTSLIKEFGMESVRQMKQAFPHKTIVADMKTIDNARYEFEMCFKAGADVATVMGVSPKVTIEACMEVARQYEKTVMFDLLNTTQTQVNELTKHDDAIFCLHVSKDQQEESGASHFEAKEEGLLSAQFLKLAAAGGIKMESINVLRKTLCPNVVIVGSAITKADNPAEAAAKFRQAIQEGE